MAKRKTQLEQAILNLEAKKLVIEMALAEMRQQLAKAPTRKPRSAGEQLAK